MTVFTESMPSPSKPPMIKFAWRGFPAVKAKMSRPMRLLAAGISFMPGDPYLKGKQLLLKFRIIKI